MQKGFSRQSAGRLSIGKAGARGLGGGEGRGPKQSSDKKGRIVSRKVTPKGVGQAGSITLAETVGDQKRLLTERGRISIAEGSKKIRSRKTLGLFWKGSLGVAVVGERKGRRRQQTKKR